VGEGKKNSPLTGVLEGSRVSVGKGSAGGLVLVYLIEVGYEGKKKN